jgi:MoaA/NifB/PqqE/SkfB family radical SAM enzyme
MLIDFSLTGLCNLNCFYCYQNRDNKIHISKSNLDYTIDIINQIAETRETITHLYGGEPTYHPLFFDIMKRITSSIGITTNLNLSDEQVSVLVNNENLKRLIVSFHEFYDVDKFINKLKIADRRRGIYFEVRLMVHQDNFSFIETTYNKLKNNLSNVSIEVVPLYFNGVISNVVLEFVKSYPSNRLFVFKTKEDSFNLTDNDIKSLNLRNFKFFKCHAGLNGIYINEVGDIYPCYGLLSREKNYMGHVSNFDINTINSETVCPLDLCNCEFYYRKTRVLKYEFK